MSLGLHRRSIPHPRLLPTPDFSTTSHFYSPTPCDAQWYLLIRKDTKCRQTPKSTEPTPNTPPASGSALLAFLDHQAKAVAVFGLHALQKTRLSNESDELDKMLYIMEMYEARGETHDPSEDGFVFTKAQIRRHPR